MIRTYFKAGNIPDLYKYNDGLEDYYLQVGENQFAIMQRDYSNPSIKFEEISSDEFKKDLFNSDINTIKSLLE